MTHYFLKCSVVLQISNFCYSVTLKSFTAFVSVSSYWRNEIFFLSVSITRKLENQLVELVDIKHFKNNNFRIEIGTAVAPLLKADKESRYSGVQWNVLRRKPKWLLRPIHLRKPRDSRCDESYQARAEEVSDCSWVSQNGSVMVHKSSQITMSGPEVLIYMR